CSLCRDVGDGVICCTTLGCDIAICISYGSNTASPCIIIPQGISAEQFMNSFVCPRCYMQRGEATPYILSTSGLAPVQPVKALPNLVAIYLHSDETLGRNHMFVGLKHLMGHYHSNLITYSERLTIKHTTPMHQHHSLAALHRDLAGGLGSRTPYVIFVETHSDPDGRLFFHIPKAISHKLGYENLTAASVPAGVLLYRFLGELWQALPLVKTIRGLMLIVCGGSLANSTQFPLMRRLVEG
ncbi:hypothetical protein C8Q78DRAFT_985737, partial [Trametes maxima]